jgi:hypothetical protein
LSDCQSKRQADRDKHEQPVDNANINLAVALNRRQLCFPGKAEALVIKYDRLVFQPPVMIQFEREFLQPSMQQKNPHWTGFGRRWLPEEGFQFGRVCTPPVVACMRHLVGQGWPVLRLNLRGASRRARR